MDNQISNISKKEIVLAIVFLLIGLILGLVLFNGTISLHGKDNTATKEIAVLNKEINNCIDKLNICENNNIDNLDVNLN